ncbi:MAG: hypothetical protein E7525_04895 [Ruminococcaceae bacterium]|nr:hypothetical protein [Oscillospiraceae bacterium]
MAEWFADLKAEFVLNFVKDDRWKWLYEGFMNTLKITFFALILGVVIGVLIATIRSTYDKNRESLKKRGGISYFLMWLLNLVSNIYLTVIRGTPVVVQLLIMYFIIFASWTDGTMVAIIAFGINCTV